MAVNYGVGGFVSSASKVLGQDGFQAITGTALEGIVGTYCLYFYETSQIGKLKIIDRNGDEDGTYLFGTFTSITLNSGAVICYGIIP